jgi:hypothetical protein
MTSVRGCGYVNGASETKPFTLDQPWRRKVRMTSGLPLQQSSPSAQAREAMLPKRTVGGVRQSVERSASAMGGVGAKS